MVAIEEFLLAAKACATHAPSQSREGETSNMWLLLPESVSDDHVLIKTPHAIPNLLFPHECNAFRQKHVKAILKSAKNESEKIDVFLRRTLSLSNEQQVVRKRTGTPFTVCINFHPEANPKSIMQENKNRTQPYPFAVNVVAVYNKIKGLGLDLNGILPFAKSHYEVLTEVAGIPAIVSPTNSEQGTGNRNDTHPNSSPATTLQSPGSSNLYRGRYSRQGSYE